MFLSAGRKGRQKKLCDDLEENHSRLRESTEHRPGDELSLNASDTQAEAEPGAQRSGGTEQRFSSHCSRKI